MSIITTPAQPPTTVLPSFGRVPTVAVMNKTTIGVDINMPALAAALQIYVTSRVYPAWGTNARIYYAPVNFNDGEWPIIILDDYDHAGILGYHTLMKAAPNGYRPYTLVFARQCLQFNTPIEQTVSHELVELLTDPAINQWAIGVDGASFYAKEPADPVEDQVILQDGFQLSNFVHPAWFERYRLIGHERYDELGTLSGPFTLSPGGYISIFKDGRINHVWGSAEKAAQFKREDRSGHRSEFRMMTLPRRPSLPVRIINAFRP